MDVTLAAACSTHLKSLANLSPVPELVCRSLASYQSAACFLTLYTSASLSHAERSWTTNTTAEILTTQNKHIQADAVRYYLDRRTLEAHLISLIDAAHLEQGSRRARRCAGVCGSKPASVGASAHPLQSLAARSTTGRGGDTVNCRTSPPFSASSSSGNRSRRELVAHDRIGSPCDLGCTDQRLSGGVRSEIEMPHSPAQSLTVCQTSLPASGAHLACRFRAGLHRSRSPIAQILAHARWRQPKKLAARRRATSRSLS